LRLPKSNPGKEEMVLKVEIGIQDDIGLPRKKDDLQF
jgi:hypothetical protein